MSLAQQERRGDPTKDGVQWTRIAEVGLLASLGGGGGGSLLRFALQRLKAEGQFRFAVCQATLAAVGFYERIGFRRVGARARYAENREGEWTGFRHWEPADVPLAELGPPSYMMALDLQEWDGGPPLELTAADAYPEVVADGKAPDLRRISEDGGSLSFDAGSGVVVTAQVEEGAVRLVVGEGVPQPSAGGGASDDEAAAAAAPRARARARADTRLGRFPELSHRRARLSRARARAAARARRRRARQAARRTRGAARHGGAARRRRRQLVQARMR